MFCTSEGGVGSHAVLQMVRELNVELLTWKILVEIILNDEIIRRKFQLRTGKMKRTPKSVTFVDKIEFSIL